jgi:hypothetical protein
MRAVRLLAALLVCVLACRAGVTAQPCDPARYYLLVFAGEKDVLCPRTAHVWAVYVRAEPTPDGTVRLETVDISWLPETLYVHILALRPEPGRNLSLAETFAFMAGPRERLDLWGPFEIDARRYREAIEHKARLESGSVLYRANLVVSGHKVMHCLRAVAAVHPDFEARHQVAAGYGRWGTRPYVADLVEAGVARSPVCNADWLLPALGVPPHSLIRHTVR